MEDMSQLPINLKEALGGTPLTYLVPTQNLTQLLPIGSARIPITTATNRPRQDEIQRAIHTDDPELSALRSDLQSSFQLRTDLSTVKIDFIEDHTVTISDPETTKSLFEGLSNSQRSLFDSLDKFTSEDHTIIPIHTANSTHNGISKSEPSSSQKHTHNDSLIEQPLKKFKQADHFELEKRCLDSIKMIISEKIGLTDEQAEYESGDLWSEWPNGERTLSDTVMTEIELLLNKIVRTPIVRELEFSLLERLQILLMRSVHNSNEIDWTFIEIERKDLMNAYASNGLKAVSLMLILFLLKREEKKLYLDTYLTDMTSLVYKIVDDYALKESSYDTEHLSLLEVTLGLFASYISNVQVPDTVITKLEYMCFSIVFQDNDDKSLLSLKISSISLLSVIFRILKDQRTFIVDEALSNFDRLKTHKVVSRQVRLPDGTNVQIFTLLMMNLVGNINLSDQTYTNDSAPHRNFQQTETEERLKEDLRFQNVLASLSAEKDFTLNSISSALIMKIVNSPSANLKQLLELFIQDLTNVLTHPEWSVAEEFLCSFTKTLIIMANDSQQSTVETYLLELLGRLGSKMLELRGPNEPPKLSVIDLENEYEQVYSYLISQKHIPYMRVSSDFFLFRWVRSINELKVKDPSCFGSYSRILSSYFQNQSNRSFTKNEADQHTLFQNSLIGFKRILMNSDFLKLYDSFLTHLLQTIDHPKIKSRTRALKNLASLINIDSRFLNIPIVKQSLTVRINDPSPLVRLAVLDIFDQYILQRPELITDFHQLIMLTNDKSTGVKLKSLRIAKRLFQSSQDQDTLVFILEKVLRKLEDDDESVFELAVSTLTDILFLRLSNATNLSPTNIDALVQTTIDVLIRLIERSEKNWNLFENFFHDSIIRKTEVNAKFHDKLIQVSEQIVKFVINFIVVYMDGERQKDVERYLSLLSIISKSELALITQDQLVSLQPYLTSNSISHKTSLYALVVLKNSLSHIVSLRDQFVRETLNALLKNLTKFNSKELEQAMPSIWVLSEMKEDTIKIANAASSCLLLLKPIIENQKKGKLSDFSDPKCLRLIYLLGGFGTYCDLERHREVFQKFNLKEKETVLSFITKNILVFTKPTIFSQVRRVAVKNLISICTTHPKLFLSESVLTVIDCEFKGEALDFKEVIIQGLLEFLQKEEKKSVLKSDPGKHKSSRGSLDVDVFHGSSSTFENDEICASLVQRYIDEVLHLCLLEDGGISFIAVKFLRFVVRLGFANPRVCISTVIALQASPVYYIKSTGYELHKYLHEKHESLIESNYINGFKLAVEFRSKLCSDIGSENTQFFGRFYKAIGDSKTAKKKLLKQILKSYDFDVSAINKYGAKSLAEYLIFLSINLSNFEFETYEEAIMLIEGLEAVLFNKWSMVTKKITETGSVVDDTLGFISSTILAIHKLTTNMRQSYKIPEVYDKQELKSQKVKNYEKLSFDVVRYEPDDSGSFANVTQMVLAIRL